MTTAAPFSLAGRSAVVVGGTRGIGRAIAERFAAAGAKVCVVGSNAQSAATARSELADIGVPVTALHAEIRNAADVHACADNAIKTLGAIDILVVSTGIMGPSAPVWEYPLETFVDIMNVNFMGSVHWLRAVLPHMKQRSSGSVVLLSSVAGKEGNPMQSAYCASKAAQMALTKSVAKEVVGDGIRVNCVAPGIVATEMSLNAPEETRRYILSKVPMGRMGQPSEIAAVVHALAAPDSGFTTGQIYDASGGRAVF